MHCPILVLMPDTGHLTTEEAAAILGVHVSSISRFVRKGELTPVMRVGGGPGGSMFFNREDIEALAIERAS